MLILATSILVTATRKKTIENVENSKKAENGESDKNVENGKYLKINFIQVLYI